MSTSATSVHDKFQPVMDAYTRDTRAARKAVQAERDAQVALLYRDARTYRLKHADPVRETEKGRRVLSLVPEAITLVTPDLRDPARDHLFFGPTPVLSRNLHWNRANREVSFATSDGRHEIHGHLTMTHNRLRAYGTFSIDGQDVAVEYHVDPQRYRMRVAKDAAYQADSGEIRWDTSSPAWKDAAWSTEYELGFTYGVDGEEVIGDERLYTFLAKFDNVHTGRRWEPIRGSYGGFLDRKRFLAFGMSGGSMPPTGPGTELFPNRMRCLLSEFGADFDGGMVVGAGDARTVYGVKGDWAGHGIAGLYHLGAGTGNAARMVTVHDRRLYAGATAAEHSVIDGDVLSWSGLDKFAADQAGIPTTGHLRFSPDGRDVVESSFGAVGSRVHPDEILALADRIPLTGLVQAVRRGAALAEPRSAGEHNLREIKAMTQFVKTKDDLSYDAVQEKAMEDFYTVLQNYMEPDLRSLFFRDPPPKLEGDLLSISQMRGTKGTEPVAWYRSLSVPYTAACLGKFSDDPYAKTLNIVRSDQWMSQITGGSDVMAAQSPLMYRRHWDAGGSENNKYLGWYLADQIGNHVKYAADIDAVTESWLKEARDNNAGTPEQLADMEKHIRALGDHAKKHKQFWAFAVYTGASKPSYLAMMESFIKLGGEVDGSEFSQRVQRTVAILNVLDTSSFFAQEYAYLLQLFELGVLLPQMADLSGNVGGFQFAVKQILDKFVETYLNSPDPALAEAAQKLRDHASQDVVDKMLAILRTTAAVGYGLFNWAFLMDQYQHACAKVLGGVPGVVCRLGAVAAMGTLMAFFLTGTADWDGLEDSQKGMVIASGVNILAVNSVALIRRSVALAEVWNANKGFWKNVKMFFSSKLLTKAQSQATGKLRVYLLQEGGPKVPANRLSFKQWWASRQSVVAEGEQLLPKAQKSWVRRLFGKNLTQFMARALAGAFAIVGIVMSSIDLHHSGEPLEKAAHAMFLLAACLELVAVIGAWALSGSALAVGGMLVSSIFSVVSVVGFVALIAGAILLIILMQNPQPTPVEKFAKERAGDFYMPYKAAIDSFRLYRPIGEPQRAGIALFAGADQSRAMRIASDGKVTEAAFDGSGHTAFYVSVDEHGRTQFGAPITDPEGKLCLQSLAVDDEGAITSRNYDAQTPEPEPKLLWYCDMQGDGTYEEIAPGTKVLKSAPFKLRSVHFADDKKATRWLAADGSGGWRTVTDGAEAATVRLEMVTTKPSELAMADVSWLTTGRDAVTGPALQVPGSVPQQWTITPAVPKGLKFDAEDGTIAMETGVAVPVAPKQRHTLKVTNAVGSAETTFTLEVVEPAVPLAA